MSKIIINGITLEGANITPLILKVKKWQSLGAKVTFFGNKNLEKQIQTYGINYNFIELKGTREIKGKIQFIFEALKRNFVALFYIKKIKRQKFDIIYSISSVLDLIIFPYVLRVLDGKIRWVAVFDNLVPLNDPGNKLIRILAWIFFRISLALLKKTDHLFTVTNNLAETLVERGFSHSKITVTGNAVEVDLIRKARRLRGYKFDALFTGRINETKGIYDMLEVVNIIKRSYGNFQLAIMGAGDDFTENKFKKRIKEMNLENNIKFLGYRTGIEKFTIIKSSKCFLFLSASESFGIALLEAVCCGLPSFSYNLPPFKEIYKNDEVMIFNKNDYKSVANAILQLFGNGEFNNERGELLLDNYNWDDIAKVEFNSMV